MLKSDSFKSRANVATWLFTGCFLIFVMVVVGGITRLTGSGLSITKWKIITGTLPPLNEVQWNEEFLNYTQTPQFEQINSHFDIEQFKTIYWWEYIHRLLGRLIGVIFIIPYIYFLVTRQFSKSMQRKTLLLLLMGGMQGLIGWYMVESGLVNVPSVSHYRLALHLTTAFLTFGLTFWFAMDILQPTKANKSEIFPKVKFNASLIFILVMLQIIAGAFVAGLDAGLVYNTFPKMDNKWIADGVWWAWNKGGFIGVIDSLAGVQFIHRYIAYVVVVVILWGWFKFSNQKFKQVKYNNNITKGYNMLVVIVAVQFLLGVFTLIYKVPIVLGVIHQAGAFFLYACSIYLMHSVYKKSGRIA
jgi:heme a synthase